MTELCELYGVSRKTGYKWCGRFEKDGRAGLVDQSRRPETMPRATDAEVIERLCRARRVHPTWSARKLLVVLREREPTLAWPAPSTASEWLRRHGLVRTARRLRRPHAPSVALVAPAEPNDLWTTDFKGEFRTGDGIYCYPLTLRDGFSRYVLRCDALPTRRADSTLRCFERAFATFGLPGRVRSDNGGPFAGIGLTGLSRLAVYLIRLDILPERIARGHPEQNGSHEQFHRVLKAETTRPPAPTARAQQRRFVRFCAEYNEVRPHAALGDRPPASVYRASRRELPRRLPPLEYPGYMEVRRVASNGLISWRNHAIHLTEVLAGQHVGCEEVDDGIWVMYFANIAIARFEERTRTVTAVRYARR
jgi:transposase InsO family protein